MLADTWQRKGRAMFKRATGLVFKNLERRVFLYKLPPRSRPCNESHETSCSIFPKLRTKRNKYFIWSSWHTVTRHRVCRHRLVFAQLFVVRDNIVKGQTFLEDVPRTVPVGVWECSDTWANCQHGFLYGSGTDVSRIQATIAFCQHSTTDVQPADACWKR